VREDWTCLAEADLETRAVDRVALSNVALHTEALGLKVPWLRCRITAAMRSEPASLTSHTLAS